MDSNYIGCQVSFPDDLLPDCPSFKTKIVENETVNDVPMVVNHNNKEARKGNRRKLQQPRRIKNNRSKDTDECIDSEGGTLRCADDKTESEKNFSEDVEVEVIRENTNNDKKKKSQKTTKFPCEECGRFFAKRYMATHRRSHKKEIVAKDELNVEEVRRSGRKTQKTIHTINVELIDFEAEEEDDEDEDKDTTDEDFIEPQKSRNSGKYCCYICDRTFTKHEMPVHMRTHDAETSKLYDCYICDGQFTKQEMVFHQLTHCIQGTKKKEVANHSSDENSVEILQVDDDGASEDQKGEDGEQSKGKDQAKRSKKQRNRFPCDVCGGLYLKSYLPQHRRSHTGEKRFSCEVCNRLFASVVSLRVHKKHYHSTDHGKIECDVCGRLVSSKMSLEQHLLTHSNEKPFQCEVCGKAFKQSSVLSNHLKTHIEGLPYQCDACGRRYKSVQGMILHRKAHHEGIRNLFPCELCEKSFTRRMKLKDHIMWHKGLSPYKCQHCGKRLVSRKTLRTHLLIHEDKKPYECKVCGKAFRQNCVLKRHMSVHTGIKPFSCEHCGKQFIHRVYLVKHTCDAQDGSRTFLTF